MWWDGTALMGSQPACSLLGSFPNEKWAPPDGSGCASSARAEAHLCWGGCRDTQGGFTWVTTQDSSCCAAQEAQLAPAAGQGEHREQEQGGSSCPNSLCCVRSSQLPSSFPLLGGNLWGKDLGAPVRVKSAPDLPCSRAAETSVPGCAHVLCR